MENKKITTKTIKELIEAKIIYYRNLQDIAKIKGNMEGSERFKFYRWALEELLESINNGNRAFNIDFRFYSGAKEYL